MITQRDLDVISPPPARRRRASAAGSPGEGWPASGDSSGEPASVGAPTSAVAAAPSIASEGPTRGSPSVSITAVITLRGPCQRPLLDELRARATTLLAAGVAELVVDLSAATAADPRLLRALSDLQRRAERHHASLILIEESGAFDAALETATLGQAFVIYRSQAPPPPAPTPDPSDPGPSDPGPSDTSTSDPSPMKTGASAP
jgi:hypothetical protein